MTTVIVTQPHIATYHLTIDGKSGQTLTVGPEDIDFPGWVWCTDHRGVSGWVPKAYLAIKGEFGQLKRDYDAHELTVAEGEQLVVLSEESAWYFCQTENGACGWIPEENVRLT